MHCKASCGLQLENDHTHLLLTWLCHTLPYSHRIFPLPFLQLLLHLVNLGRVQSPQTAFPRRVAWFVFNFLKAFVQGQVVAHGVLPAIRGCLETQSQSKNGFSRKKKQSILYIMKLEKKNQNQNKRKVILMPKWTNCVPYNWNMGFYTWLLHFFCFTLIFKPVVEAGGFFKPHCALKWFFHVYFLVSAQAKFHPYSEDSFARRKKKLLITLRCCIWACWSIS